jgi:hypothetical protein
VFVQESARLALLVNVANQLQESINPRGVNLELRPTPKQRQIARLDPVCRELLILAECSEELQTCESFAGR